MRSACAISLLLLVLSTSKSEECLREANCDGYAALGVECAFLESAATLLLAPYDCNCSQSLCAQDGLTYSAPQDPLCDEYVNDDLSLNTSPCVVLTKPVFGEVVIKNGDALKVDGRGHHWSSGTRRPITIEAGAALDLRSVTINGLASITEYLGACVFVGAGSRFSATFTSFVDCKAVTAGGGILAWTGSELRLRKTTWVGNYARIGGGVAVYQAADALLEESQFKLTSALARGGCVFIHESATIAINGTRFDGCSATEGGALHTRDTSVAHITDSVVEHGWALAGGVILAAGMVYATNSTFQECWGTIYSGGVLTLQGGSFFAEDCTFRALTAGDFASAFYILGFGRVLPILSLQRCAVEDSPAVALGSVYSTGAIVDLEDVVVNQGSGLVFEGTTVRMLRVNVDTDTPRLAGGCLSATEGTVVTIIESRLRGCAALSAGAVFVSDFSRVDARNLDISDASATAGSGGGAAVEGQSVFIAIDSTFVNCTAIQDGGAVALDETSRLALGGATTLDGNVAAGSGGAVAVRGGILNVAPRCTFVALTLDFSQGGFAVSNSADAWLVKVDRGGIDAYFDQRGVLAHITPAAGSTTTLEVCLEPERYELWTESFLAADWDGGTWGLEVFGDGRDFKYDVTRDPANGHPNLVHGARAVSFKIFGGAYEESVVYFSRNIAHSDGGAIAALDGGRVTTAATVAFDGNAAPASAGGAVFLGSISTADIHGILVTRNGATNGAALAASTLSEVRVTASTMRGNVATGRGGALHAEYVEALEIDGVSFVDNLAGVDGGAIALVQCERSLVVARSVVCSGNLAKENGGGIAIFASTLEIAGVALQRNYAVEGSGGALYVIANSDVILVPMPACVRTIVLTEWTGTWDTCLSGYLLDNEMSTCDSAQENRCRTARNVLGEDVCDGCACFDTRFEAGAENHFEILANDTVVGMGTPRASAIVARDFCLSPAVNASAYRLVAYDSIRGQGWFGGKLYVAVAMEDGAWYPEVEDFGFDGKTGDIKFNVGQPSAATTRFVENVAGGGGGAIMHVVGATLTGLETVQDIDGNTAGYGSTTATPPTRLEFQSNVTLVASSGIIFHLSAQLRDAKGQVVTTDSSRIVDARVSANIPVEALGTRNTTRYGVVDFDALTIMAPVGTTCRIYLESSELRSPSINITIVPCSPGYEEEIRSDNIRFCSRCQADQYWYEGRCRECVVGMLCESKATVPLEHRIVGDSGSLALRRGYHRQSIYSRRPVLCDGGNRNPACPGGVDIVRCDAEKNVIDAPRCGVQSSVETNLVVMLDVFSKPQHSIFFGADATTTQSFVLNSVLAIVVLILLAILGPLAFKSSESLEIEASPQQSEATLRLVRALGKVQTKYKALYAALQIWVVLIFSAPIQLPDIAIPFLDTIRVFGAFLPGSCLTNQRFSLYKNLLVWTIVPFALVAACVVLNSTLNLVRSIKASLTKLERLEGQVRYPFCYLLSVNFFGVRDAGAARRRSLSRQDSRYIFTHGFSDSHVAMTVLVIVIFLSYPPMAYVVLSFFAVDTFDDPHKPSKTKSYARFDLALRAEGPTYRMYSIYAGMCVATHVVGVPAFFAFALHRVRDSLDPVDGDGRRARIDPQKLGESRAQCAIVAEKRVADPKLRPLRPLWLVYLPQYFNFEVFELLRRMMMMTVPVLVTASALTQMSVACGLAYASTRLYRTVRPFLSESDSAFFENIQWLTLILTWMLFYLSAAEGQSHDLMGYAIVLIFVVAVCHSTILVVRDMRQEKFVIDAIKIRMAKLREGPHMTRCIFPSFSVRGTGKIIARPEEVLDVANIKDTDDGSQEASSGQSGAKSPSKVASDDSDLATTSFTGTQIDLPTNTTQ